MRDANDNRAVIREARSNVFQHANRILQVLEDMTKNDRPILPTGDPEVLQARLLNL